MKVKIAKCSDRNWWYKDKIGQEFEVLCEDNSKWDGKEVYSNSVMWWKAEAPSFIVKIPKSSWGLVRWEDVEGAKEVSNGIDAHYNFNYSLSPEDIDNGYIKLDPYFVAKQWKLGSKDDTGILFHCFKLIARFGDKNPKEREILALYKQAVRLAELEGVELK